MFFSLPDEVDFRNSFYNAISLRSHTSEDTKKTEARNVACSPYDSAYTSVNDRFSLADSRGKGFRTQPTIGSFITTCVVFTRLLRVYK